MLGTAHAEEISPEHPLVTWIEDLRQSRQLTEIELGSLNAAETAALGAQVARRAFDSEQEQRLFARTEGHPLYIVELVSGNLLRRAVAPEETSATTGAPTAVGVNEADGADDALAMPEVFMARIRQLLPDARAVAGLAAAIGRQFNADLLIEAGRAGNMSDEALIQGLEELLRRRIVREQGAGIYDFTHDKLRVAAYMALSGIRRRSLHRQVARALEAAAADAPDDILPRLVLHYERGGEPLNAAVALERASRLAIQRGLLSLAREYLQRAITLAPESDQMRLYEELGDGYWLFGAYGTYGAALQRWRQLDVQDSFTGARLLRKMLYAWLRTDVVPAPAPDELTAMALEAQELAEHAGYEDEAQRIRIASRCLAWRQKTLKGRGAVAEEIRSGWIDMLAAVNQLASSDDWDGYQNALDAYSSCLMYVGAHDEALELVQMRLHAERISPYEYADAVHMLSWIHFSRGDYQQCITVMLAAGEKSNSESPVWTGGTWFGAWSAWFSGDWDALDDMVAVSDYAWEKSGHDLMLALASHWATLHVGLARDEHAMVEVALSKLQELATWVAEKSFTLPFGALLAAYQTDNVEPIVHVSQQGDFDPGLEVSRLMFFNERGEPAPHFVYIGAIHAAEEVFYDCAKPVSQVAEAITANDPAQLAAAIEEAEAHRLIPHAARMRIVLAQWTGDRAHLERARPVLERLGDRQFLRRLEAVEATLQ